MTIGFKTARGASPISQSQSSPLPPFQDLLDILQPRQGQDQSSSSSSACVATCPAPNPCPSCPVSQICVGIPRTCQACASNVCQADPEYKAPSHKSTSPIGGALGGVLAILAVVVVGYLLWNRRKKRRLEIQRKIRNEAKIKEAGVAFRPKRKSKSPGENPVDQPGGVAIEMNDQKGRIKSSSSSPINGGSLADDTEEILGTEEETEWTEMRSDGLTVYKKPNGIAEREAEEEYLRNLENKRYSSGAATHLSRITEGIEEEDEVASLRASSLHPSNPPPLPPLHNLSNSKNHSHSSSINLDPINTNGSGARSRKSRTDFNGFNANPFSDSASENSSSNNHSSKPVNHMNSPIATPDPVHRPTGAPLVDLQSGKSPSRRGSSAPSTSSSSNHNHGVNESSSSGHSSNGGGMSRNLLSPAVGAPMRPSRAPDLNLRLADGAEPGMKSPLDSRFKAGVGTDSGSNKSLRESSATFDSYNSDASGRPMSPAAASSNFHHSSSEHSNATMRSPFSPNNMISPGAKSQRFDFMSVDPTSSAGNYSSALESSNVYSRNDDKRLSSATVGTLGTMMTTASDYVLKNPQIMTLSSPSTSSNPARSNPSTPGFKGGLHSPIIIRPANAGGHKPQVHKNLAQAKERGLLRTSPITSPISEASNPFSDDHVQVEMDDGNASSASSLAPRIRNPFSDDHSSETDQDFQSISDQSQNADRALSPAGTFGNASGRSKSSRGASRASGGAQTPNTFGGGEEDLEDENEDFISEMNARNRGRNNTASKSFNHNNRDSTATFQTVASGFSMGIPFVDLNKSGNSPLRNPETSSPRDEREGYDISEIGGERSSWLSQSPSLSSNFNRNAVNQGKEREKEKPASGSGSGPSFSSSSILNPNDHLRRPNGNDERASMISNLSSNSSFKADEDIVINQAAKVDLKRTDSARRLEYEVGKNGIVGLSRSNSKNQSDNPTPHQQSSDNDSNSRVISMAANSSRQSNASSIGGLSAFEFAPFNGEEVDNETMPKDAVERAKSHRLVNQKQSQSHQSHERPQGNPHLNPNRELNSPLESPINYDEGDTEGKFEDEEFLRESREKAGRNGSVRKNQNQNESNGHDGNTGSNKVINTGADRETVEQIRLAHELSNYPFQMG